MSDAEDRQAADPERTNAPGSAPGADAGADGPEGETEGAEDEGSDRDLLNMSQAIEMLKTTRSTFYRWLRAGKVKGMKVGRQWRFYRGAILRFMRGQGPRVDLPADISPLLAELQQRADDLGVKVTEEEGDGAARAVSLIIAVGCAARASDIHVEVCPDELSGRNVAMLRYRVDGVLGEAFRFDLRLLPAVVEEWKRRAACDVNEKRLPQDGRILLEFEGWQPDLRVCFVPLIFGEAVTVRILDSRRALLSLDRIEFCAADRERLNAALASPCGLIVVTGPTGCGKTTVLYACLNRVAGPGRKAMSVEDPVEYLLPWVSQMQVDPRAGVTFARAVRSILRSDPDIVMVGEMRDRDSVALCQQVSLTGHLILTTLHTVDAAGALVRMVEMGSDPFVVADATLLVSSQRLVRKLCRECAVPDSPSEERLALPARAARAGGLDWDALAKDFRRPVGCKACGNSGYRGRNVIAEMLDVTPEIGKALREGAGVEELRRIAVGQGMTTMAANGVRRAAAGETTLAEVVRTLGSELMQPGIAGGA